MRVIPVAFVLAIAACGTSSGPSAPPEGAAAPASAADRYTARGRVIALHAKEIEINTERIPAFKAVDGKVSPMEAMPMGYVIGDGVARDGLAVGDPIQLTFEVRWADANPLRLTQVVKLPADTQLALP